MGPTAFGDDLHQRQEMAARGGGHRRERLGEAHGSGSADEPERLVDPAKIEPSSRRKLYFGPPIPAIEPLPRIVNLHLLARLQRSFDGREIP